MEKSDRRILLASLFDCYPSINSHSKRPFLLIKIEKIPIISGRSHLFPWWLHLPSIGNWARCAVYSITKTEHNGWGRLNGSLHITPIFCSKCDIDSWFFFKSSPCNSLQNFMKRPARTINCRIVSNQHCNASKLRTFNTLVFVLTVGVVLLVGTQYAICYAVKSSIDAAITFTNILERNLLLVFLCWLIAIFICFTRNGKLWNTLIDN